MRRVIKVSFILSSNQLFFLSYYFYTSAIPILQRKNAYISLKPEFRTIEEKDSMTPGFKKFSLSNSYYGLVEFNFCSLKSDLWEYCYIHLF